MEAVTVQGAGTDLHHADEIFLLAIGEKVQKAALGKVHTA